MTIAELIEKYGVDHDSAQLKSILREFSIELLKGLLSESKFTDNPQERLCDEVKEALEELRK